MLNCNKLVRVSIVSLAGLWAFAAVAQPIDPPENQFSPEFFNGVSFKVTGSNPNGSGFDQTITLLITVNSSTLGPTRTAGRRRSLPIHFIVGSVLFPLDSTTSILYANDLSGSSARRQRWRRLGREYGDVTSATESFFEDITSGSGGSTYSSMEASGNPLVFTNAGTTADTFTYVFHASNASGNDFGDLSSGGLTYFKNTTLTYLKPGPTPEPFTMGLGIAGLAVAFRRMRARSNAN